MSFAEIMSQQLAEKLSREEQEATAALERGLRAPAADEGHGGHGEDEDESLARRLQEEFNVESGMSAQAAREMDPDLLLALRLQQEEDAAAAASAASARRGNMSGKVRLTSRSDWEAGARRATQPAPQRKRYGADDWEAAAADDRAAEEAYRARYGSGEEAGEPAEHSGSRLGRGLDKHNRQHNGRSNVRDVERALGQAAGGLGAVKGADGSGLLLSNRVANQLRHATSKQRSKGMRSGARVERQALATREGVLDVRTRLVLYRMVLAGLLDRVHGVLRTGKEASVYLAEGWRDGWADRWHMMGAEDAAREVVEGAGSALGGAEEEEEEEEEASTATGPEQQGADGVERQDGVEEQDDDDDDDEELAAAAAAAAGAGGEAAVRDGAAAMASGVVDLRDSLLHGDAGVVPEGERALKEDPVAIKVFRTTLSEFRNRTDYIRGEHRFRRRLARLRGQNPRKVVRVWAEKEFSNLYRLHRCGLPVPRPRLLRGHVLVMDFIGGPTGRAAPQLREAKFSKAATWRRAYLQTVSLMHGMYTRAELVHADLSEYNLLWHKSRVWVLDVGQSVQVTHPSAGDFLRMDCRNVTDFFERKGVRVLPADELFRVVTDTSLESVFLPRRGLDEEAKAEVEEAGPEEEVEEAALATPAAFGGAEDPVAQFVKQALKRGGVDRLLAEREEAEEAEEEEAEEEDAEEAAAAAATAVGPQQADADQEQVA